MAAFDTAQMKIDKARTDALRKQGIEQANKLADESGNLASQLEARRSAAMQALGQAEVAGKRDIRAQSAQALAAGQATGASGGNAFGALGQAGLQSGIAQGQFGAESAQAKSALDLDITSKVGEARQAAAAQRLEATKFEAEAGNKTKDTQEKKAGYDAELQKILASTKSMFGDDSNLARQKIEAMVAAEEDEEIKAYYMDLAKKYQSEEGAYDY